MPTFSEVLLTEENRPMVIRDVVVFVGEEVGRQALPIRLAYRAAIKIMPNIVRMIVEVFLDKMVEEMDSFYQDYLAFGGDYGIVAFIRSGDNAMRIAQTVLIVMDSYEEKVEKRAIRLLWGRLRPRVQKATAEAAPRAGEILARYGI
jgi:hypothetical protein